MTLHIPPELAAKLARTAAQTARTAAQTARTVDAVALDQLSNSVVHDEWFRRELENGRTSARAGRLLDHDEGLRSNRPSRSRVMHGLYRRSPTKLRDARQYLCCGILCACIC